MDNLRRDDFAAQLNTKFNIYFTPDAEPVEAELIDVSELKAHTWQESFSILFNVKDEVPLLQWLYKIEHPELGASELFLVPVGKNAKGTQFEALFNRLIE